jgi:hypothetical protein
VRGTLPGGVLFVGVRGQGECATAQGGELCVAHLRRGSRAAGGCALEAAGTKSGIERCHARVSQPDTGAPPACHARELSAFSASRCPFISATELNLNSVLSIFLHFCCFQPIQNCLKNYLQQCIQ